MNIHRILRLAEDEREKYIKGELEKMQRPALVHLIAEYGDEARNRTKQDLVNEIAGILLEWAGKLDLES